MTLADAAPIVVLVLRAWSIGSGSGLEVGAKNQTHIHPPDPLSLFPLPTTQAPGHHRREKGASNKSRRPPQQQRALPCTEKAAFIRPLLFSDHPVFHLKTPFFPILTVCASVQRPTRCAAAFRRGSWAISTRRPPPGSPSAPVTLSPRRKRAIPLHPPTLFPPYTQPSPPTRIPPPERDTGPTI